MSGETAGTPIPTGMDELQHRGMRRAILTQTFATPAHIIFDNGVLLLYMTAMHISPGRILFLLSLYSLTASFLTLTSAYFADRLGTKTLGLTGILITIVAFVGIVLTGFASTGLAPILMGCGIVLFSLGASMLGGGWFGLLHPLVPEQMRGRFFGKLRLFTRLSGLLATIPLTLLMAKDSPVWLFQIILSVMVLFLVARFLIYRGIPEMEPPVNPRTGVWVTLSRVLRTPGYVPFLAYVFLLALFTRNAPVLFSLLEKEALGFGDNLVVAMGFALMLGAMMGFYLGGRAVDRFGTRVVFVACHMAFGLVFGLFLLRESLAPPVPVFLNEVWTRFMGTSESASFPVYLGLLHFLFGWIGAVSGLAVTTEMFALMPRENKAFASGICTSLTRLGIALAGMLSAWVLDCGILASKWTLAGAELSAYDALLLLSGIMVLLLVVTLSLVPSVIGKVDWNSTAQE